VKIKLLMTDVSHPAHQQAHVSQPSHVGGSPHATSSISGILNSPYLTYIIQVLSLGVMFYILNKKINTIHEENEKLKLELQNKQIGSLPEAFLQNLQKFQEETKSHMTLLYSKINELQTELNVFKSKFRSVPSQNNAQSPVQATTMPILPSQVQSSPQLEDIAEEAEPSNEDLDRELAKDLAEDENVVEVDTSALKTNPVPVQMDAPPRRRKAKN
jgi:hypothetical protein